VGNTYNSIGLKGPREHGKFEKMKRGRKTGKKIQVSIEWRSNWKRKSGGWNTISLGNPRRPHVKKRGQKKKRAGKKRRHEEKT